MEKTLAIIKPDGVERGIVGEVIRRIEKSDLKIAAIKMIQMSKSQAEGFYFVHKSRPFFDSLTSFMSSGPVVVMVLKGEGAIGVYRQIMGATNYQEAIAGTIRRDFATDIEKNVVHGSDSKDTANVEIAYFFNALDVIG